MLWSRLSYILAVAFINLLLTRAGLTGDGWPVKVSLCGRGREVD